MAKQEEISFEEWFDSLSPYEQKEYVKDMEADYWIEENKNYM